MKGLAEKGAEASTGHQKTTNGVRKMKRGRGSIIGQGPHKLTPGKKKRTGGE